VLGSPHITGLTQGFSQTHIPGHTQAIRHTNDVLIYANPYHSLVVQHSERAVPRGVRCLGRQVTLVGAGDQGLTLVHFSAQVSTVVE